MLNPHEPMPAQTARVPADGPYAGPPPASVDAGLLRSLREAEDDARAILAFVTVGLATRDIDPAQVVWVVDLAPGDGERAWHVVNALAASAPRGAPIRYLACCASPEQQARLAAHPSLQPLIVNGSLWLDRSGRGIPPHAVHNPLVVLAHEGLSARLQGLYAAHYGALLEAWGDDGAVLEWRPAEQRTALTPLLTVYRQALNSAAFSLPLGAIETLAALLRLSGGRLLLRASDRGAKALAQIRLGALNPRPDAALPVNFEALARWHRSQGANVYQNQRNDEGRVLHLALHDRPGGRLQECLPELLALPHPDDHAALLQALHRLADPSPEQCLAALHAHGGDPRALWALARPVAAAIATLTDTARQQWRDMLRHCWAHHYPRPKEDGHDGDTQAWLAALAIDVQDWPLARQALRSALRANSQNPLYWQMLAHCQVRTGRTRGAMRSLRRAQASDPADPQWAQAIDEVRARLAAWHRRPAYSAALARDARLVLEPLDSRHAEDFFYQYRDPQIGPMTRLPVLSDAEMARAWVAAHAHDEQRLDCAVLHADYGFVGVVGAHWTDADAVIYFWLGADYQGRGLATRAADLMRRLLVAHGIGRIFAEVYPDNYRSLRTLKRLGFVALPICARAPEEATSFFCWSRRADEPMPARCEALRAFARRMGGVLSVSAAGTAVSGGIEECADDLSDRPP